ncbi:hypothetical protein [Saccharopolyspora sp. 6V]|uniref:hypothetical protein n=1 Tax=Saccharopolyspora sp. 6V TaxID=2877239 RepID=UPI001CD4FE41|nr:hypothetical protein [Saccharopolyspora sp. 6V]MCA1191663.1 hypothetical protein [Saccharopolyspora sp. 6V]
MTNSDNDDLGDRQLKDGRWENWDFYSRLPDDADVAKEMKDQGWNEFFSIGDGEGDLGIKTWQGKHGYLLQVADAAQFSPFLKVDTFPELMELLAKWAPAVQAASVSALIRAANDYGLHDGGVVENLAAKAAYGVGDLKEKLEKEKRQREQAAWRRRQQRGQG